MAGHELSMPLDWWRHTDSLATTVPRFDTVRFLLMGEYEKFGYDTPVNSLDEVWQRIIDAAEQIRTIITSRVTTSEVRRRLRACIRNRGSNFEQDLQ